MMTRRRLAAMSATIGLLSAGIVAVTGVNTADAATPPSCDTQVVGVLPSGKLIKRDVHNTKVTGEKKTAAALPFRVDYMYGNDSDVIAGGVVSHFFAHAAGQPVRRLDVTSHDDSPTLTAAKVGSPYRPSPKGRLFADSGRFYTYGVDTSGRLTRWTRFTDNAGHFWFGGPKVVKSGMGGLKALSFMFTWSSNGVRKDVLYGTTKSGALVQFQIPWNSPGKPKFTTVKKTGFSSYTGLSLSWCNRAGTLGSLIAIDKTHNQARWYTLARQMTPKGSNLVRHPLVAPGIEWRLHATF